MKKRQSVCPFYDMKAIYNASKERTEFQGEKFFNRDWNERSKLKGGKIYVGK